MNKTAAAREVDDDDSGDMTIIRLEPLKTAQPPEVEASPSRGKSGDSDGRPCYRDAVKVTTNGVHDIEDRILRITGYYGYYPGYSSHRRSWGCVGAVALSVVLIRWSVGQAVR
ncbi:hypothetical protein AAFF_G00099790 [Aldrovandia affinis]|uniref:Uncharacterized protein n=1 Tax=Aldrovandia affinis TaxID=143900 RepID=A0AAD7RV58_9TELE|nr:hypothetical protein AAFF_G00099790 [Aldrovandia affinis]